MQNVGYRPSSRKVRILKVINELHKLLIKDPILKLIRLN